MGPKDMRMFYHSFNAATQKWTVGTAASKDGFVWKKAGPIFAGSDSETDFDGRGAASCHVVRDFTSKRCAALVIDVCLSDHWSVTISQLSIPVSLDWS